jgi:hypothetical protein
MRLGPLVTPHPCAKVFAQFVLPHDPVVLGKGLVTSCSGQGGPRGEPVFSISSKWHFRTKIDMVIIRNKTEIKSGCVL